MNSEMAWAYHTLGNNEHKSFCHAVIPFLVSASRKRTDQIWTVTILGSDC